MYTDWFWNEDKGFHHTDKKNMMNTNYYQNVFKNNNNSMSLCV